MGEQNDKIVVSGDICVNTLLWTTSPQVQKGWNWQMHDNMHSISMPGESMLLARLISLATGRPVFSPQMRQESTYSKEFLHSTAKIERVSRFPAGKDTGMVYRISYYLGFTGTSSGLPKLLPVEQDDADASMVVIDDENNGFNEQAEFWPLALKTPGKKPLVLYKLNNPNESSALWKHLVETHIEKMIIIINSEDLRAKGVNISKSISWERTAQDFVWQLNNNPTLSFLASCRHLIFTFGLEGAIYYKYNGFSESRLYFMPYQFEGDFTKGIQGGIYGYTSCFVAGLVKSIAEKGMQEEELVFSINDGIREGIVAAQKYYIEGFGGNTSPFTFPHPKIFLEDASYSITKENVQDVKIHIPIIDDNSQDCWYILNDKSPSNLVEIAAEIVKYGDEKVLKFIPVARFGNLKTVDRKEIESYRSINNLMGEYIATKNVLRPLSIAVFGTPGSGKSFGVTEVAANIAPELITKLNFNLSQFRSPSDLAKVFHKARDFSLHGKVPVIVFDEFDTSFEGKLGWLKYFLAPMQDGLFREEDAVHPIGKAIFVFAGGTSSTFEEFCGETISDEGEQKRFIMEFKSAKGPDFVSRLRGNVNILGPNPASHRVDQLFVIRRAMLLRSLFERKLPHLINDRGEAQIDNGVLRALLKVPRYKHESRSMEAIMDMSILTGAKKWEQSYLPSMEQLKLHVDEEQFTRHLMHDVFYSEKIDSLAFAIFEMIQIAGEKDGISHKTIINRWDGLAEEERNFYREHIRQIPDAMVQLQYDIVSVIGKPEAIKLSEKEVRSLAEYTHDNWFAQKKELGWKFGEFYDALQKTNPKMASWENLNEKWKKQINGMVEKWPAILAGAHFKVEYLTCR